MSHQAYFDYLEEVWEDIEDHFNRASSETKRIIFKLTASPYYFWEKPSYQEYLEFIAQTPPKASAGKGDELTPNVRGPPAISSSMSPSNADASNLATARAALAHRRSDAADVANLANKAQEIRSFVRANLNDKDYKHMTKSARNALLMLLDGRMLADMPDEELVKWYESWVKDVKI